MAYCRFGSGADVYAFRNVSGWLECCGCGLHAEAWGSYFFRTTAEFIGHLEEHRAVGHQVPESVFERLREEEKETDEWLEHENPEAND